MSCQPSSVTQPTAQSERAAVGGKPSARNQERHPLCRWHMRTQICMHGKTEERKRERKRGSWICKNTEICIYRIIWRSCNTTWIPEKLECSLNLKTKRLLNHIKYYYLWVIHYLQYIISRKYSENLEKRCLFLQKGTSELLKYLRGRVKGKVVFCPTCICNGILTSSYAI